jgi:hypothetical protein
MTSWLHAWPDLIGSASSVALMRQKSVLVTLMPLRHLHVETAPPLMRAIVALDPCEPGRASLAGVRYRGSQGAPYYQPRPRSRTHRTLRMLRLALILVAVILLASMTWALLAHSGLP